MDILSTEKYHDPFPRHYFLQAALVAHICKRSSILTSKHKRKFWRYGISRDGIPQTLFGIGTGRYTNCSEWYAVRDGTIFSQYRQSVVARSVHSGIIQVTTECIDFYYEEYIANQMLTFVSIRASCFVINGCSMEDSSVVINETLSHEVIQFVLRFE
jgi:hypothetical protein